jgi:hypothetical protein
MGGWFRDGVINEDIFMLCFLCVVIVIIVGANIGAHDNNYVGRFPTTTKVSITTPFNY